MNPERKILIGISAGIAAYKIPLLIRNLRKKQCSVKVVITPNAKELVGVEALRTLSGFPVYTDSSSEYDMEHIRLSEWADTYLIAPATANTIAKITHGIADNLLTSLALSIPEHRLIITPAMNTIMWQNQATQENLATLKRRGIKVLPVGEGELACGISGLGRMLEPEEIADWVLGPQDWELLKDKHILISSGPTEEPIDPVRVITNRSSGKMGAALARIALRMGARVTVVTGPAREPLPVGAKIVAVQTARQMQEALLKEIDSAHVCIMAAAISDYRVAERAEKKIERKESGTLQLELVSNPDITESLTKASPSCMMVGFALETSEGYERPFEKMKRKGCSMMVVNRPEKALGTSDTEITLLYGNGKVDELGAMSKEIAAESILRKVAQLTSERV